MSGEMVVIFANSQMETGECSWNLKPLRAYMDDEHSMLIRQR